MIPDELFFLPLGAFPVAGTPDGQTGYWVNVRDVPREELEVGQACRVDESRQGFESEYARKEFPRFERIRVFRSGSNGQEAMEVHRRVV